MLRSIDPQEFLDVTRPLLCAGDARGLAHAVLERWAPIQICDLLTQPNLDCRRVAAVTLGLVGDKRVAGCLAQALHDADEQVNHMAEHSLWAIWFRSGSPQAAAPFREGVRQLASEKYPLAVEHFTQASTIDPSFAEAHNQCAVAHFFIGDFESSLASCRSTIDLVPIHFGAIAGMGHCYASTGELSKAQRCYVKALQINPCMPAISAAIARLQSIRSSNDSSGEFLVSQASD